MNHVHPKFVRAISIIFELNKNLSHTIIIKLKQKNKLSPYEAFLSINFKEKLVIPGKFFFVINENT